MSIRFAVEIRFGLRAQADFVTLTVEWLCSCDEIVHVVLLLSQYL